MAKHDWHNILKQKDEKELIHIYSGNSSLNSEAEIYAGLELKNRDFDFQTIEPIHTLKRAQLKNDIQEYENLKYVTSKYFKDLISFSIGFVLMLFMQIFYYYRIYNNSVFQVFHAIIFLLISLFTILLSIPILSARWRFERFKKKKRKLIELRAELFNK